MKTSDGTPAGWVSLGGVLQPGDQVGAYAARGQMVKGVCNTRGCRRRVDLDPTELCGRGMGLLDMGVVKRLYHCSRLDTCGIDFHKEPMQRPLRLADVAGRQNVRIRLKCQGEGCTLVRVWIVEQMIEGLRKQKKGSERTTIDELPKLMTAACPACKRVAWAADVLWARMDTTSWRSRGEGVFDRMESGHVQ